MSTPSYISTVVPAGYERWAVRLGGALLCVIDVPAGQGNYVPGLAHRWLTGGEIPGTVIIWDPGKQATP